MDDINAMIARSEAEIAAGRVTDHEEMMREWEEELEREELEDLEMSYGVRPRCVTEIDMLW